jgi:hypothetical protein
VDCKYFPLATVQNQGSPIGFGLSIDFAQRFSSKNPGKIAAIFTEFRPAGILELKVLLPEPHKISHQYKSNP